MIKRVWITDGEREDQFTISIRMDKDQLSTGFDDPMMLPDEEGNLEKHQILGIFNQTDLLKIHRVLDDKLDAMKRMDDKSKIKELLMQLYRTGWLDLEALCESDPDTGVTHERFDEWFEHRWNFYKSLF